MKNFVYLFVYKTFVSLMEGFTGIGIQGAR